MARLKTVSPRIGMLKGKLDRPRDIESERQRTKERDRNVYWRRWYKTARWQKLRLMVLARDGYVCHRTGVALIGKHPAPNSPVVDHIVPHEGDEALFWSPANLQSVSKEYHDGVKKAFERRHDRAALYPEWLKPSLIPLTIVCGPPCSGKSTYVRDRAGDSDMIIDLDMIAHEISGEPLHGWSRDRWLNAAIFRRNDLLGDLSRPGRSSAAWFIVGAEKSRHRQWWQDKLAPMSVIVLETSEPDCIDRAKSDDSRIDKTTADAIVRWWFNYDRRSADTIVTTSRGG
jgi:5-methylcytosine-specific restriction endonuclease McrA